MIAILLPAASSCVILQTGFPTAERHKESKPMQTAASTKPVTLGKKSKNLEPEPQVGVLSEVSIKTTLTRTGVVSKMTVLWEMRQRCYLTKKLTLSLR